MKRGFTVALGLTILLAACGGGNAAIAPRGTDATTPDGDWQLVSGVDVVDGHPITLSIEGARISGRAACNGYGGAVAIKTSDTGVNTFTINEFFMNGMGCEAPIQESEQTFVDALFAITSWRLDDAQLHLVSPSSDLVFEMMAPIPTAALIGTEWVLESLIEGATVSSVGGEEATLLLGVDGTVSGSTGCRTLEGTWIIANGEVLFPSFSAYGDCESSLANQDGFVVTVLGDGFRAEIEADRLTATSVGNEGLQYRSR